MGEVASMLRDPGVRLLTLTGPGGVGKTRLAVAVAASIEGEFTAGAGFVDLSPVRDPNLVPHQIAGSFGLRRTGTGVMLDRVLGAVGDRQLLLVLDNFEQVVVAAPWLRSLIAGCPALKLLVTSRIRLRISGEQEYPVAPLSVQTESDSEGQMASGAVRLFVERARAIRPGFKLTGEALPAVTEIVRRVDGLPLAIELAAARTGALPPVQLLQRMEQRLPLLSGGPRDLPLRQQTMRETIAWSYDLLADREQALFRRFAVFVGGFDLDAAEALARDTAVNPAEAQSGAVFDVIDGLSSLIEHSLLRQVEDEGGESRYLMLETVREFARERLAASGEDTDARHIHADHYLAFAQDGEPGPTGTVRQDWLGRMEREKENLRAALAWFGDRGDAHPATRFGAALWRFWESRGYLTEGRMLLDGVLDLIPRDSPDSASCGALTGAGVLAALQGDYDQAILHSGEAVSGWRRLGNPAGVGRALLCLAEVARYQDDFARADSLGREALAAFRSVDDRWGIGHTLAHLGMVAWLRGDHPTKDSLYEEALSHLRDVGDQPGTFQLLLEMGKGTCDAGDLDRAARLFEECLALAIEMGDEGGRGAALAQLGVVARLLRDHVRAKALLTEAATLAQDSGDRRQRAWVAVYLGDVHFAMDDIEGAVTRYAEALRLFLPLGNRVGIAQCLEEIGKCAAARDQATSALRLFGASSAMFAMVGVTPPPDRDPAVDVVSLKAKLDPAEFTNAWRAGQALTYDDAASEALALVESLATPSSEAKVSSVEAVLQEAGGEAEPLPEKSPPIGATLGLTPRELEVLRLLAEGRTDREIADVLSISERTAGNHVQHAMQKIGVESRTAAAVFAVRHHLD